MAGHAEGGAGPVPGRKLLKLLPLDVNQVPYHPELHADGASHQPPALSSFVQQCLKEANEEDFSTFQANGETNEIYEAENKKFTVKIDKLKKKDVLEGTWFARRSTHTQDEVTFEELDSVLRKDHETNEMQYTPAIYDANTLLTWRVEEEIEGVDDVELRITQMHHSMPGPGLLNDRVFTVLLVSFIPTSPAPGTLDQSIDLQLPVQLQSFPAAIKERSHTIETGGKYLYQAPASATDFQKKQDGRKLVDGRYASLEKLSKKDEDGKEVSKWEMMTLSDAEGALPQTVQKLGVPSAIVKDVPLALAYIKKRAQHKERGMNFE